MFGSLRPLSFGALALGERKERILQSPRFQNGRFENTLPILNGPMEPGEQRKVLTEFFFGDKSLRIPKEELPVLDPRQTLRKKPSSGLRATWLGHSTVLLEIAGLRLLTDPVWGERTSPFSFVGPKRFHRVPMALESLPDLDAVLV